MSESDVAAQTSVTPAAAPAPTAAAAVLFNNVFLGDDFLTKGSLKLHPSGVGWKPLPTSGVQGRTVVIPGPDVTSARWIQLSRNSCQLKIEMKGGAEFKFTGLKPGDRSSIGEAVARQYGTEMTVVKLCTRGGNCGDVEFEKAGLRFGINGEMVFEVPFQSISQCATAAASKTEVVVEFHPPDVEADVAKGTHQLIGMRFHVPNREDADESSAKSFQLMVAERAKLGETVGKGIGMLTSLPLLTPRGKYDVELFPSVIKFHGHTYDYQVPYGSVMKLTALEKSSDTRNMFFVISLDPPLRQGQQRYTHLVLHLDDEKEIEVKLNLTDETRAKWPALTDENKGTQFKVVSDLMSAVTSRKIARTGTFTSSSLQKCVRCAYRANDGFLYPLETALMFIHKPPIHLRYDEITHVEFARMTGEAASNRTFDITVHMNNGTQHTFNNIYRQEYTSLFDYIAKKGIKVKNAEGDVVQVEDFSDSEGDEEQPRARLPGEDLDSEEEDDDFVPEDEEDVPEEYDADYLSEGEDPKMAPPSDDDDDLMHPKKKKEKEQAKEEKSDKDESGSSSGEEDKKEKKAKKDKKDKKEKKEKDGDGEKHKHKHKHHHHHDKDKKDKKDKDKDKKEKKGKREKDKGKDKDDEPAAKKRKEDDEKKDAPADK